MNNRCPHFHGFLWECGQPCVDKQAAALPRVESGGTPPHTLWTGKALPPSTFRAFSTKNFPTVYYYDLIPLLSREIAILRTEVTLP